MEPGAEEGCWARTELTPGAYTPQLDIDRLLSAQPPTNRQTFMKVNDKGQLDWDSDSCPLRWIRLSDDCHTCNCVLGLGTGSGNLTLRIIRHVRAGEELQMWFSEETLASMDIPFLNPVNIRGEKTYVCQRCGKKFEYPNPLKVHLALECGRRPNSELWERLAENCKSRKEDWRRFVPERFTFSLTAKLMGTEPESPPPSSGLSSSESNPGPERDEEPAPLKRPSSEPPHSAFRPYGAPRGPLPTRGLLAHPDFADRQALLNRRAAEIETLVSNMGQSKQGHLCLYCGKLYSRKYGLKIHIRTHTGFKPLKCKYCFRPFGDPSNLNKHVRLHSESETPYKCALCGKVLVRRRDLERHIKSRHRMESAIAVP